MGGIFHYLTLYGGGGIVYYLTLYGGGGGIVFYLTVYSGGWEARDILREIDRW